MGLGIGKIGVHTLLFVGNYLVQLGINKPPTPNQRNAYAVFILNE